MEFMVSEKDRELIVFENYKFRFQKMLKNDVQRWSCCNKKCTAFLKLNQSRDLIESSTIHNHDPDSVKILNRQKISNSSKRKAVDVDFRDVKPSKIWKGELRNGDVETLTSADVDRIRLNIGRARRQLLPPLPKDVVDMQDALDSLKLETNRGEKFLLVNDKENKIVMFSTIINLTFLCQLLTIFVDGTFYSCPKQFTQVFTIIGLSNNVYVPLVSFLLLDKRMNSYATALSYIASECEKLNLIFAPDTIYVDFEIGIHTAIRSVLNNSVLIKGCRFHLGQCWWRKIQELGLSTEYKDVDSNVGQFLKNFFGLAFLDPVDVQKCFLEDLMPIKPQNEKVQDFCDYIWRTYISSDSKFPPHVWSEFAATVTRTTNGCEAYHSKLNSEFYRQNPNIYTFVNALQGMQIEAYVKMRSVKTRHRNIVEKEQFLIDAMLSYQVGFTTRFEFVRSVSRKFLPV